MSNRILRRRFADWPERLATLVEERRHRPFAWGVNDCITWASDVTLALTGRDPWAAHRGTYSTEAEADRVVGAAGLEALVQRLMHEAGAAEIPVAAAQRGDWAIVTIGNMPLVGAVLGPHVGAPGDHHLAFVPLRRATRAWAI